MAETREEMLNGFRQLVNDAIERHARQMPCVKYCFEPDDRSVIAAKLTRVRRPPSMVEVDLPGGASERADRRDAIAANGHVGLKWSSAAAVVNGPVVQNHVVLGAGLAPRREKQAKRRYRRHS